jgi:hypothetical protein
MYIGTSSDVTLQSQSIEMVEDRMLVWMVVGSERRLVVYGTQSLELGVRGGIVASVIFLSPFEMVHVWFTPDAQWARIV